MHSFKIISPAGKVVAVASSDNLQALQQLVQSELNAYGAGYVAIPGTADETRKAMWAIGLQDRLPENLHNGKPAGAV